MFLKRRGHGAYAEFAEIEKCFTDQDVRTSSFAYFVLLTCFRLIDRFARRFFLTGVLFFIIGAVVLIMGILFIVGS